MPSRRREGHPLALFYLVAYDNNQNAKDALAHSDNRHHVWMREDGTLALDIGFNIRSRSSAILATIGRNDTDIRLHRPSISKLHCSFEIDLHTNVVMLHDRSFHGTTQVYGENATPFEHQRQRQVVVQEDLNTVIGMGGARRNLYQFELIWYRKPAESMEMVKNRQEISRGYEDPPSLIRTVFDEGDTEPPSRRETRPHTAGPRQKMRYATIGPPLGSGQFGTVHKAVDADTGKLMAVKILRRPVAASGQDNWTPSQYHALKREVEHLSELDHPNIVDYITSQGWDGPEVEIFMGLKAGTLKSLLESGNCPTVAESVFHHILQALDCLAMKDIIHRDVKPENILWVLLPDGQHQFQLGDFGLCNRAVTAFTTVGSPIFMAPEMLWKGEQTHKVDVWSLFVTMLWTLDAGGFRHMSRKFKSVGETQEAVQAAASNLDVVSKIQEMAVVNPLERASAAQMLVKCFNGAGLSTPRNRVPALISTPAVAAAERSPSPVSSSLAGRSAPKNLRRPEKNANMWTAQKRIEKARYPPRAQSPGLRSIRMGEGNASG